MGLTLNPEQLEAVSRMREHIEDDDHSNPFIVLSGPAGTGKTTCIAAVREGVNKVVALTAPTNKAVKVIRENVEDDTATLTIFSLLGLQLMANDEIKRIGHSGGDIDLSACDVVVVDEAFMVGSYPWSYIEKAAEENPRVRWILAGDPYQLPPVKEVTSPVCQLDNKVSLAKVMRTDNQILNLATRIRGLIDVPGPLKLDNDHDTKEGVWKVTGKEFLDKLRENAADFANGKAKAMAWRNVVVDNMNKAIRQELMGSTTDPWTEGDRITMLEPANDAHMGEKFASTDDDGIIRNLEIVPHPMYPRFLAWKIEVDFDYTGSGGYPLFVLHEESEDKFKEAVANLAEAAKKDRRLWKDFWNFKDSFHKVRHAYATTCHRAQGSTYVDAYVNYRDVMSNPRMEEALRCLYVACTRPKRRLILS